MSEEQGYAAGPDPVTRAALALVGDEGAAWVAGLGAGVPASDGQPWLAPVEAMDAPPELEGAPRGPR